MRPRRSYGYRSGYPLETGDPTGHALPRRAVMMAASGPGVPLLRDTAQQVTEFGPLQAADLVFFDADPTDGPQIDHVGIYLGVDSDGRHRFLSSRKTANGPTLGNVGGASLLDGGGLYARRSGPRNASGRDDADVPLWSSRPRGGQDQPIRRP